METLMSLLGALIGAYVTAQYARKSDRRVQLVGFAGLLEGIADCLERMEDSLRKDVAPTADGHRLQEIVDHFAGTGRNAPLDTAWKKEAESLRSQLQLHLRSGEIFDDIIRGYVIRGSPEVKERMLHAMVVTSDFVARRTSYGRKQSSAGEYA